MRLVRLNDLGLSAVPDSVAVRPSGRKSARSLSRTGDKCQRNWRFFGFNDGESKYARARRNVIVCECVRVRAKSLQPAWSCVYSRHSRVNVVKWFYLSYPKVGFPRRFSRCFPRRRLISRFQVQSDRSARRGRFSSAFSWAPSCTFVSVGVVLCYLSPVLFVYVLEFSNLASRFRVSDLRGQLCYCLHREGEKGDVTGCDKALTQQTVFFIELPRLSQSLIDILVVFFSLFLFRVISRQRTSPRFLKSGKVSCRNLDATRNIKGASNIESNRQWKVKRIVEKFQTPTKPSNCNFSAS